MRWLYPFHPYYSIENTSRKTLYKTLRTTRQSTLTQRTVAILMA